jgi:PAS domain S-box-containing protein
MAPATLAARLRRHPPDVRALTAASMGVGPNLRSAPILPCRDLWHAPGSMTAAPRGGETHAARHTISAYVAALLGTALACLMRVGLEDVLQGRARLLTFIPAITIAAYLGGLRPGLGATALSTFLGWYVLIPPRNSFTIESSADAANLVLFAAVGASISWVCERMHAARDRAAAAERELRESERRLQRQLAELHATYATAPVGLCVLDTDLRHVRINERLAEINGVPAAAHLGRTVREIVPAMADELEPRFRRVLATGEPVRSIEVSGETPAQPGVRRTWLASYFPLRDEGGKVLGVNVVCEEITEQKRAEAALREANEAAERSLAQLQAVIGSMHEGLSITSVDGALRTANEAGLRICGVSSFEEMRAAAPLYETYTLGGEPLPPEDRPLARVGRGERFDDVELRVRRRDTGVEQIIAYAGGPVLDREGRRIAGVITFQDVTAQKRAAAERERLLESERAARAEAERANRSKDEFLAVVSHELRTPLNAILGWSTLLRRPGLAAAQLDKGLAVVERNTRLLVQLISDLLDVSRIVAGKLHVEREPVDLAACVEAAVESLRNTAAAKGVAIHEAIESIGGVVRGDPARLQQVAMNLVSNAIKFTPAGGRVEVRVARRGGRAEIVVRDTGQGIDPGFLPHVFDRFRQADGGTTRQHGGLGLGLAIVRSLVELHDGSVRVESEGIGKGATFTVSLPSPAGRPAFEVEAPLSGEVTSLRGVRVLVVDDEHDMRELLERVLAEHGAAVTAAASAEEALSLLSQRAIDVLVSDISMPGMDGYGFVQKVRSGGARDVPAVALTGFARAQDRERALSAGYLAHLTKPIDPAELVTAVARLSGRGAGRREAEARVLEARPA